MKSSTLVLIFYGERIQNKLMVINSCSYPLRKHRAEESPHLHPWPPSLLPFPRVATEESEIICSTV